MGLVVLWHVESSQIRDGTQVSCTGRQILYHWTIREAQAWVLTEPIKEFHTLDSAQVCATAISQAPELGRWSNPPLPSGSQQWPRCDGNLCAANNSQHLLLFMLSPVGDGFPGGSVLKNLPAMQDIEETQAQSLAREDPLEDSMATHSSALAWRIPQTDEPGGPQSMGSQRGRHDWVTEHTKFSKGKRRCWAGPGSRNLHGSHSVFNVSFYFLWFWSQDEHSHFLTLGC